MLPKVDKEKCIGCGSCIAMAEEVFVFEGDNKAGVKPDVAYDQYSDKINQAKDACPVQAISVE